MDRSYSSKVMKNQGYHNNKFETSGVAKASLSGQSKKRPVPSFAGNVLKKKKEVTKGVSGVDEAKYNNMCHEVNPLPKIGEDAASDDKKKRNNNSTANKKCISPSIKAPIYPSSVLQHRITSCRRKPLVETLVKSLPIRAPPIGAEVKPSTEGNSRPSTSKRSIQFDTKKQSSQNKTIQQLAITTTVKKVTIAQETQENAPIITDNTTPFNQPLPTASSVSFHIVYATNNSCLLYRSVRIMMKLQRSVCNQFWPCQL